MKIHPVEAEFFCGKTDGRTDSSADRQMERHDKTYNRS